MNKEIRILIVEDTPADAELIARELGKGDLAFTSKWVKSSEEFFKALEEPGPDLILCDYTMPLLGAPEALVICKRSFPETPFIVVSGTIGEDTAVEMLKSGAADYVMKDRLSRLVPAVKRALKEADEHIERKRAEEALAFQKNFLAEMLENMDVAIVACDKKGELILFNRIARDWHGLDPLNLPQEEWARHYNLFEEDGVTPMDVDTVPLARAFRGEKVRNINMVIAAKGQPERHILAHAVPIKGEDGQVLGAVAAMHDITKSKAAEETLRKFAASKAKFVSMVSHELKTPLAVIKEALGIVLDGLTGEIGDEQKDILDTAKRNAERLGRLISDVLDFQKIEAGKMGSDFQEHDLNEVIQDVRKSLIVLSRRKNLELRVEVEEGLPKIKFDKDQIGQVIFNLVSNAIKSTSDGSVTVGVQRENNMVHIRVRDTGRGISAEDLPKLFVPFEKLDRLHEQETGGTGLGLSISKELILAHHGKIFVESKVGSGTTIHFTLPL